MVFLSLVNFAQSEDLGTTNHQLLRNDLLVSMSPTNKWLNGVTLTIELPTVFLNVVHVVYNRNWYLGCLKMSACHVAKRGGQEQRRTYRGPCRKMQAMSATFYRHISCYVGGDAKLGRPGLKKSVLPVLFPNSFSYKSVGGLGLFILMKSATTRGGIKNEGIFLWFSKVFFP